MGNTFGNGGFENEEESCASCGDDIEAETVTRVLAAAPESNSVQRDEAGNLLAGGAFYCAACAPEVDICRTCGCTDASGCVEGCWWIEPDLCSSCEGAQK